MSRRVEAHGAARGGDRAALFGLVLLAILIVGEAPARGLVHIPTDLLPHLAPYRTAQNPPAPHNALVSDALIWLYPRDVFARAHIRGGEPVPRWDPLFGTGEGTALAQATTPDYPVWRACFSLLSVPLAHEAMLLVHLALALTGMFLWLRARGAPCAGALAGALVYGFSGELSSLFEVESMVVSAACVPWCLLSLELGLARGFGWLGLGALAAGGAFLGGYHSVTEYGLAFVALYALFLARGSLGRRVLAVAILLGLGALIGTSRLVPALAELGDGSRVPWPFEHWFENTSCLTPHRLLLLVGPDLLGDPIRDYTWGQFWRASTEIYASPQELRFAPGIVALAAAAATRRREARLLIAAVAILAVTFPTPLAWPLWRFLPGLGATAPTRILFFFPLACALVAAHGWRDLVRGSGASLAALGLSVAVLALVLAGVVTRSPPGPWLLDRALVKPLGIALSAFGLVAFLRRARGRSRALAQALLLGLLAFDVVEATVQWNPKGPTELLERPSPMIDAVRRLAGDDGRALADEGVPPGILTPWGIRNAGSYSNAHPRRFARFLAAVGGGSDKRQWLMARRLPPAWRDVLGIRVVLADPSPSVPEGLVPAPGWTSFVWANPTALPRFRVFPLAAATFCADEEAAARAIADPAFDPRAGLVLERGETRAPLRGGEHAAPAGRIEVVRDAADHVLLRVSGVVEPSVVLVADAHAVGWHARVDEKTVEILPADVAFRAIPVEPGDHRVALDFEPAGRAVTPWVSCMAALIALAAVAGRVLRGAGLETGRRAARSGVG